MKFEEFNRIYASNRYRLDFRQSRHGNYLRLLDDAGDKELAKYPFSGLTADLPEQVLEFVKTLLDGDLST